MERRLVASEGMAFIRELMEATQDAIREREQARCDMSTAPLRRDHTVGRRLTTGFRMLGQNDE